MTMTNATRLTVGETTYDLVLGTNQIVEAETALGIGFNEVVAELQASPKIATIRTLLCVALRTSQPKATLADAGEIMDRVGLGVAVSALGDALAKAFAPKEITNGF